MLREVGPAADGGRPSRGTQQVIAVALLRPLGVRRGDRTDDARTSTGRSGALPVAATVVLFASGCLLRIWILRSSLGDADSDEAVTGLMAMHFTHGQFRALYWGATYAGTLEPFLTSVVFRVVGPSVLALKAVPIALTLVAALLVWRAAREYFGPAYGPLEGAVFWVYPAANVLLLMKAQVVYASGSCFVIILLLLALRLRMEARPWQFFAFGLVAGLSVWATPLALATILPIAVVTACYTWRKHVLNLLAVAGAIVGALPWLWHSIENDWITIQQVDTLPTTYWSRLRGCLTGLYPLLLGLRKPITGQWLISPTVGKLAYVVLIVAIVVVPLRRFGTIVLPLVVTVVVFPFLYAVSTTSWYTTEPRHGLFIAPLLLLLAVSLVPRRPAVQVLCFGLLLALSVATVGYVRWIGETRPGHATVRPGKLEPVIDSMRRQGFDSCYGDYWISYRITFESKEGIICAAYWGDRYHPYRTYAEVHGARVYLFLAGTPTAASFEQRLDELRLAYATRTFDTVQMFVLDQPQRPNQINQCVVLDWLPEPSCPTG